MDKLTPQGRVSDDRPPDFPQAPGLFIPAKAMPAGIQANFRRKGPLSRSRSERTLSPPLAPAVAIEIIAARTKPDALAEQGGV